MPDNPAGDDEHALEIAAAMDDSRRLTEQDERDTIDLLDHIDKQIVATRDYAQSWEEFNEDRARLVREEEKELHELRAHLVRIIESERGEVQNLMRDIRARLDAIKARRAG
jgi:hypothetical protein